VWRRYSIDVRQDVWMVELSQNVRLLEFASYIILGILPMDLIKVDQLADQLLSCLNVVGEAYGCFCSATEAVISHLILAGKQLALLLL
jgi:hypothetical protein